MVNKQSRVRVSSDGKGRPQVDGSSMENELLLGLPSNEGDSIFSKLTFLQLRTHDVLHESEQPIKFAYFMNSGLTSILTVMAEGKNIEVGLVGKEGFVGIPLLVGFSTSPSQAVIQIEGSAFRIGAQDLGQVLSQCPILQKKLQQYGQIFGIQGTQVAACNRLHEVDERLARWLLMSQDRIDSDNIPLTHEFLAHMLGTRRPIFQNRGRLPPHCVVPAGKDPIQIGGRADQREMGKCLRKVSEVLPV